jgi:hypothetical protein
MTHTYRAHLRFFTLLATLLYVTGLATPAAAQDAGFPPFPIIYDGTVEVDDVPLAAGTLTARVGDWTSVSVPVVDGRFACADPCLIVGPPTFAYVGREVTFHLADVDKAASLKFEFPNLAEPSRRTEALEFKTNDGALPWLIGGGLLLAVVMGGGVVALMFRRGEPD